ncbi:hypothetical protein [Sphingomonas sp. ERG5]|uniref:hypothetical protein n=1 Tax=Sphingomonas sp. ERG5 TaxID=1381597 RepID=UPI00054B1E44|nr:hypothetical protein [Sphingomonas sp. ERG5]
MNLSDKPRITAYHALVQGSDGPEGVHSRVSIDAENLTDAQARIEAAYPSGRVASIWGDWESDQLRGYSLESSNTAVQC